MTDDKKVVHLQSKMDSELQKLEKNLKIVSESMAMVARARKEAFDIHVQAGFTEKQALELVKELF